MKFKIQNSKFYNLEPLIMIIGILKESGTEKRVAMLPGEVAGLKKLGVEVVVENNAGERAYAGDEEYRSAGAVIVSRKDVFTRASVLVSVDHVPETDLGYCREGHVLCSILNPVENAGWLENARKQGLTMLALDLVPRTTRAQSMDILSSMATLSGYKAVLHAASLSPRFFPMFMSAAGTIKPSRVLILGAGVAGLQAIAIARKLGAVVEVFDVRSAVKDEVRSLGGRFIEVEGAKEDAAAGGYAVEQTEEFRQKQSELIHQHAVRSDVVICTAQIPGKKAPVLLNKTTVNQMKPGSVIIDLAASAGGNCELPKNSQTVVYNQIKVIGNSSYPSEMPYDASSMFGRNVFNFVRLLIDDKGNLNLDFNNEIIKGTCLTHDGEIVTSLVKE